MSEHKQSLTRLCTVGTGYFSQFHYDAWSRLPVGLTGLCSKDHQTAEETATRFDATVYEIAAEMFSQERPELVDIITPPPTHVELVTAAIQSGVKTIICQKPFTEDIEQAEKLARFALQEKVSLIVHENFRFQPWHIEIKRLLEQQALGDVFQITFVLRPGDGQGERAYLDRQPYFQSMPRFLVRETAVHLVDVFRYLLGEPEAVWADLRKLNPIIAGEDAGIFVMQYANNQRALFDGNRLSDHIAENRRLTMGEMRVEGSAATLRLNGDGSLWLRKFGENQETEHLYDWHKRGFAGDSVFNFQSNVLENIATPEKHINMAHEYIKNLQIVESIYASSESQASISL